MKNPWFALYVSDYLAKTGHLTQAQHGAYLLLMLHYYGTGSGIPSNAMQVHAICRCTNDAERRAADMVLQLFFYRDGDFYRHKRIDEELATRSELRTKRQIAASKRWDAKAMQLHTHSHSQIDIQSKKEDLSNSKKKNQKPSLEEVSTYCSERKNSVDPQKFCDYYAANGWKVGRNAMKDWRAAIRTWEKNGFQNGNGKETKHDLNEKAISRVVEELYGPDDEGPARGVFEFQTKR